MAHIHDGIWSTLRDKVDIADISNGDTATVYYNSRSRLFTFNSSSTEATKDTRPGPYYLRPHDYSTTGVWEETIGNDYDVFNAGQIIGSVLRSTNWGAVAGSYFDLDAGTIQLGGSSSPAFSVTAAGLLTSTAGAIGGFTINGTSGLYAGAGATRVQMQPGVGIWTGATAQVSALNYLNVDGSGWLANKKIEWTAAGAITLDVPANAGTGVGVIYKGGARWLYDFNPAHNGTVQPAGYNTFLGVGCGNLTIGSTATNIYESSYNVGIGYETLLALTKGQKMLVSDTGLYIPIIPGFIMLRLVQSLCI